MLIDAKKGEVITRKYGQLCAQIFPDAEGLGIQAAQDLAAMLHQAFEARGRATLLMATGNSQLWLFSALHGRKDIPWDRVTVFLMDEYIGLPPGYPGSLTHFAHTHLTRLVPLENIHSMSSDTPDPDREIQRYSELLAQNPPDGCVMGIGENGHLAFNDPPADFTTYQTVHKVRLDEASKQQQVGEGHFPSIETVPNFALSLTIPALLAPPRVMVVVPEKRKARAVRLALEGPVTPECPASILQNQPHAVLYLDRESASLLA